MASLSGNAGGSKQNSNISISLTSGNLASQLESIKNKANLSKKEIEELTQIWNGFQNNIKNGEMTQKVAFDAMENHLEEYGIVIDDASKKIITQKEKIKDVEIQSKESIKEEIKDQHELKKSVEETIDTIQELANRLNGIKAQILNRPINAKDISKFVNRFDENISKEDPMVNWLREYARLNYTNTPYDKHLKDFMLRDEHIFEEVKDKNGNIKLKHSLTPLGKKLNKEITDWNRWVKKHPKTSITLKDGLEDSFIADEMMNLLAAGMLSDADFAKYQKKYIPDKDGIKIGDELRAIAYARLWHTTNKDLSIDSLFDYTNDKSSGYSQGSDKNYDKFIKTTFGVKPIESYDTTKLKQKAQQAKDDIIKTLETGIYEKAIKEEEQILEDLPFTDYDNTAHPYNPNTFKQLPALNYVMDYENRMRRRGRALYNLENNYTYGNDVINAYDPQNQVYPANIIFGQGKIYGKGFTATDSLNLPAVVEGTYREITNNVDKINQATQQTANEIVTKAQQATPAIEQATQATNNLGQKLSSFAQDVIAIFTKIGRDMSLTFRDFGNSIRTWSSVMYSAIHLAQALENTMNISDSMIAIAYRLERYDNTGASRQTLLNRAFSNADNARSDIDSYATLAQRILATNVTNGNADEAMRLASLITKSMVLGGSTAQEQRSAQLQLSQALASNILGGDELRAIRENAIGFTEMLARGLTRGYQQGVFTEPEFSNVQIGNLKELGKKQLLTADVVTKAIGLMEDEINKDFSAMPELFSQTMAKLMNTFKKRLNEFNQEGKGLGRIVKLFQDLEKWLNSDKGKQVLDSLLDVFDRFIDKISQIASFLGNILNGPIGSALLELVKLNIKLLPLTMGSKVLLGSSDIYGNQRAGLLGYGGLFNIGARMLQLKEGGGNWLTGLFGSETINGRTFAMGGLIPNLFSMGVQLFNALTGQDRGDSFAKTVLLQKTLMDMLSSKGNHTADSLRTTLKQYINVDWLDKNIFANNWKTYTNKSGEEISKLVGRLNDSEVAGNLLNGNVFAHLAGNTATAGVGNALGNPIANAFGAKGGIIGKALGVAAAHPIATAIVAALGVGVVARNHFDKKADEEDLNRFLDNLPNPAHWSKLQEEDRTALRSKAVDWYNKYTSGAFIGVNRNWSDKDFEKFIRDYVDFGDNAYGRYLKSIADNTGETASNTAGTLDITDEFIRNMNDIRTRSFRGELLMNGNGVNNTWNVVVHNEGDVKNIAEKIQQAVISAQEGMLNTPVMM